MDSGASDHMTGDIKNLKNFKPCHDNLTVKIADGSLSKVAGTGSVVISKNLILHSVLLVHNLDCNLLSISKLTQELNCMTKFFPNHCEFQDLDSGKMIGNAEMCSGLYLLKIEVYPERQPQTAEFVSLKSQFNSNSRLNNDSVIMLWHYRLGHPNFVYLEKLFPVLFDNKSSHLFQCEICQLSKHTRQVYPNKSYQISYPFSMIHSDV